MSSRPLNPKQLKFVERYQASVAVGKPNATQAYIDTYGAMDVKTAKAAASRLLTNVNVQQLLRPVKIAAETVRAEQVRSIEISRERIRTEMARLAFVSPKAFFRPDGSLKSVLELDDDTAAALAQIEVEEEFEVLGPTEDLEPQPHGGALKRTRGPVACVRTTKVKLWDKRQALRDLADTEPGVWAPKDGDAGDPLEPVRRILAALVARFPHLGSGDGPSRPALRPADVK